MTKALLRMHRHTPSALQRSLEFSGGRMVSLSMEHPLERMLRSVLIVIIAVLALAYLYFVSASVLNVIARREAAAQLINRQSDIGILEQQYYRLTQGITPHDASRIGLVPLTATSYVYPLGNTAAVRIGVNEI